MEILDVISKQPVQSRNVLHALIRCLMPSVYVTSRGLLLLVGSPFPYGNGVGNNTVAGPITRNGNGLLTVASPSVWNAITALRCLWSLYLVFK